MSNFRIPMMRLMERKSQAGRIYFTGYLGDMKIVMFKDEKCESPRYGAEAEWQVFGCEKEGVAGKKNGGPQGA